MAKDVKVDPKKAAKEAAEKAKKAAAEAKANEAKAAKEKAEKEKEAAANKEKAKKEKEAAAAAKKAEKEAAKQEKAEAREADKAQREALKGGPGKRLRSLIARIKYMIYMDNPSAGIEDIELLTWTLSLTNTQGTIYTAVRGETTEEVILTVQEKGKKAVSVTVAATQEALEEAMKDWTP